MSDSSSPPRKRQRMSSPTYDEQLAFPSQDELKAIGQIEISLSQVPDHYRECASKVVGTRTSSQNSVGLEGPQLSDRPAFVQPPAPFPRLHLGVGYDDPEDPFASTCGPFTGFIPASASNRQHPMITRVSPDPETGQNEGDIAVGRMGDPITPNIGFTSASGLVTPSVGFASASALAGPSVSVTRHGSSSPPRLNTFGDCAQTEAEFDSFKPMPNNASHNPFSMFTSLGKQKKKFQPSAAALRTALERAKRWAVEDDVLLDPPDDTPEKTPDVAIFPRQALPVGENVPPRETSSDLTTSDTNNQSDVVSRQANVAYNVVDPPSLGQADHGGTFRSAAYFSTPGALRSHPVQTSSTSGMTGNAFTKPFKSPFVNRSVTRNSENSQHTPSLFNAVASTPTKGPKAATLDSFPSIVNTSGSGFYSPMPIRGTPLRKVPVKKFVTPFKPGMRPGEPGHGQLKARIDAETVSTASGPSARVISSMSDGSRKPTRRRFFDLTVVQGRKTLASCGFRPGVHAPEVLANMGINVAELLDINLKSALQHRFHLSPQDISSSDPVPPHPRGSVDALRDLKGIGCHLATQEWVDNHWSLILWKLAGMASLDPKSEADVDRKRWSWAETMRQLQYRYEKELNRGARPALRLITAQDVSAGFHMILCVSGIVWSESGIGNDGLPLVPHPTLELTDGWYRLRTRVDEVLARAARRGVIRVGRKIAVSGASIPRNTEPCEVLGAYDKVELNIAGNGTHLAPWHAKLGFQPRPALATLHTLSPDGGIVPCLQLVVYPIAFIEFCKDGDGKVTREGPRREKEESAAQDTWARKREREYQRLRKEAEDKQKLYLDWARRFEIKSGGDWHPREDDDMPGHIESMFDDCDCASDASSVLRRASKTDAGWLARFALKRVEQEKEAFELGLERELQSACPPREVRSFRVLLMRDACATRRPARRVVELTVWDVLTLSFDEAPAGQFKEGQRFQVSNLLPTQKNAWMDRGVEGGHVYLSTTKTSRWIKLSGR